ncbi:MAG: hypothetical protein GMKNLPBB_00516 [Myxococcota bacterium]|nr:hypothetical protein [Myxococcota bacterium]
MAVSLYKTGFPHFRREEEPQSVNRRKPVRSPAASWASALPEWLAALFMFPAVLALAGGAFASAESLAIELGATLAAAASTGFLFFRRFQHLFTGTSPRANRRTLDVLIGAGGIILSYILIQATGALDSPFYPMLYLIAAAAAAHPDRVVTPVLLGAAALLEIGLFLLGPEGPWLPVALHLGFAGGAAFLYHGLMAADLRLRQGEWRARWEDAARTLDSEARAFRLHPSAPEMREILNADPAQTQRIYQASLRALRASIDEMLASVHSRLAAQTTALLLLDSMRRNLRVKEYRNRGEAPRLDAFPAREGAPGAVFGNGHAVAIENLRHTSAGLPYHGQRERAGAFLGAPVTCDGKVIGVLVCDWALPREITGEEQEYFTAAGAQLGRCIEVERVLVSLELERGRKETFYRASEQLNTALTPQQVLDRVFEATRNIAPWDFAAVTRIEDAEKLSHIIMKAEGAAAEGLQGQVFRDNAGLVSLAVRNRHVLPHTPFSEMDERHRVVFTPAVRLKGIEAVKVFPLVVHDRVIGALVLGSNDPLFFTREISEMLHVMANQAAVSLDNAYLYESMERLAITDGLTGLVNHRTFQDRLDDAMARCNRSQSPLSLLLVDIDHFKKVNDTHGHPVGDEVLRRVARTIAGAGRETDINARYGGEEFAVVLENTDAGGAFVRAERLREDVEALLFASNMGQFKVTLSIGVAAFPEDAQDKHQLIARADAALYRAKKNGRNQVMLWNSGAEE